MRWKKEYNNGIPLIDTQHKQLFRFSEELQTAISSGLKPATLNNELVDWISNHITGIDQKFGDYYQDYQSQKTSSEKST